MTRRGELRFPHQAECEEPPRSWVVEIVSCASYRDGLRFRDGTELLRRFFRDIIHGSIGVFILDSLTELVIDGLKLLSKIDWETIKSLASKHRIHPDLLVDTAIMYFSQLNSAEQKFKIADYLEKDRNEEIEREKSAKENHKSDSAE